MTLAKAWKRKATIQRRMLKNLYKRESEWLSALRLAGIGKMADLNPDAIRLTITVPSQKRIKDMVDEALHACPECHHYDAGRRWMRDEGPIPSVRVATFPDYGDDPYAYRKNKKE